MPLSWETEARYALYLQLSEDFISKYLGNGKEKQHFPPVQIQRDIFSVFENAEEREGEVEFHPMRSDWNLWNVPPYDQGEAEDWDTPLVTHQQKGGNKPRQEKEMGGASLFCRQAGKIEELDLHLPEKQKAVPVFAQRETEMLPEVANEMGEECPIFGDAIELLILPDVPPLLKANNERKKECSSEVAGRRNPTLPELQMQKAKKGIAKGDELINFSPVSGENKFEMPLSPMEQSSSKTVSVKKGFELLLSYFPVDSGKRCSEINPEIFQPELHR